MSYLLLLTTLIFSVLAPPTEPWELHTIDASSSGADGVKLADINKDGLLDITTGWEEGGLTKLYLHPGKEQVHELWPSVVVGKTADVEDAVFADMTNDGMLEVVSCAEGKTEKIFVHYANSHDLQNSSTWQQQILPASDGLMKWMYAEPLQVDGENGVDLIAAGKGANSFIGWFEAPEDASDLNGWKWHAISPMGWVMSILLRDMDGDGDMDIIVTDRRLEMQACRWLENPGLGAAQKDMWPSHTIGGDKLEVMFMTMADINGDGNEEVIVCERTNQTILIYSRLNRSGTSWAEKLIHIPESTGSAKSIEAGDVNNDGIIDLVLSTNTNGKQLAGLTWIDGNELNKAGKVTFQEISGRHNAKYDKVELLDIDLDGDLDVLICEENYGDSSEGLGVVWYENPIK